MLSFWAHFREISSRRRCCWLIIFSAYSMILWSTSTEPYYTTHLPVHHRVIALCSATTWECMSSCLVMCDHHQPNLSPQSPPVAIPSHPTIWTSFTYSMMTLYIGTIALYCYTNQKTFDENACHHATTHISIHLCCCGTKPNPNHQLELTYSKYYPSYILFIYIIK